MNPNHASTSTKFRVGLFTILGLALVGAVTVFVNDRPFWWRSCQLVQINIEDATGLKTKSPIRSLGLQIGYLRTVELSETHVRLGICITAPVEVLPTTRAYIRGEGFLGDKFVELKPVKYIGERRAEAGLRPATRSNEAISRLWSVVLPEAHAEEAPRGKGREIPVGDKSQDMQQIVDQVDTLVGEMTELTKDLKQAINPKELRATMQQLNRTLENASKTLAPEGGLNTTAQRTLSKLEDAIEQLRDMMTRVNKGEGSVGMLLNDPTYAEEIREAVRNVNRLLSKVGGFRFLVNLGGEELPAYDGGRGWFTLGIWPARDRYYLLGVNADPRGQLSVVRTETTVGGSTTSLQTTQINRQALLFTAMLGKVFWRRLDLAIGMRFGDGAGSVGLNLGPTEKEEMLIVRGDVYARGQGIPINGRVVAQVRPLYSLPVFGSVYLHGGLESIRKVNGDIAYTYGMGITFDDEDVKLLFALL